MAIRKNTDWKNESKKNFLELKAFRKIVDAMFDNKEKGNAHFKGQEFKEAIDFYKIAMNMSKQKEADDEIDKVMQNDKTFYRLKYDYLKINTILYSNSAMANLKLEHFSRAMCNCCKGKKIIERLKILIDDEKKFEEDFGLISKKLDYRLREALDNEKFLFRHWGARHSDEPEEGLGVGSLITHCDDPSGRGGSGIFDGSKVLMYEFKRDESIMGVIINKKVAQAARIGGPCGLRKPLENCDKIYLHNMSDMEGSKKVIEGVYWHDSSNKDPLIAHKNSKSTPE